MFILINTINKINQIDFNNKNRCCSLKQINNSKKVNRNRFFKINFIDSLWSNRLFFNQKTRSIFSLSFNNNNNRIVLTIITSIINIKINNRLINVLIRQTINSNAFITRITIKRTILKKFFKVIMMVTIITSITKTTNICYRIRSNLKKFFTKLIQNRFITKSKFKTKSLTNLITRWDYFLLQYRKANLIVVVVTRNFRSTINFIITSSGAKWFLNRKLLIALKLKLYTRKRSKISALNLTSNSNVTSRWKLISTCFIRMF